MSTRTVQKTWNKFLQRSRRSTSDDDSSDDSSQMVKSVMLEGSGIPTRSPAVIESIDFSKNAKTNKLEFFSKDIPFFWLSNSSEHPLYVDGARYPTAEHLFQAQ